MPDLMTADGLKALEAEYQAIVKKSEDELARARQLLSGANKEIDKLEARMGGAVALVFGAFILGMIVGAVL